MRRVLSLILCVAMLIVASPVIHSTVFILGDANHDGSINARDALLVRKVIAGIESDISDEGDVDRNGDITFSDPGVESFLAQVNGVRAGPHGGGQLRFPAGRGQDLRLAR